MKVKSAYLFSNLQVMVFGYDYHQIPELQGAFTEDLLAEIKKHSDENTEFYGFNDNPIPWNNQFTNGEKGLKMRFAPKQGNPGDQ